MNGKMWEAVVLGGGGVISRAMLMNYRISATILSVSHISVLFVPLVGVGKGEA